MKISTKDKMLLESLISKYGVKGVTATINKLNENEDVFNAEKCLRQLIKNKLLDKFNPSKYEIWEYAEMAEEAAEDAGFPIEDAELLHDYLMDGFVHYYDSFVLYLRNI